MLEVCVGSRADSPELSAARLCRTSSLPVDDCEEHCATYHKQNIQCAGFPSAGNLLPLGCAGKPLHGKQDTAVFQNDKEHSSDQANLKLDHAREWWMLGSTHVVLPFTLPVKMYFLQ